MNVIEVERLSSRKIEAIAPMWLSRLCPDSLFGELQVDVIEVLELLQGKYGFDLSITRLPPNVEARVWPSKSIEISAQTYRAATCREFSARFILAHECGHASLNCHQIRAMIENGHKLSLNRRINVPPFRDPEWQAKTFASAFLMPLEALRLLGSRASKPSVLSVKFGVSTSTAKVRIKNVKKMEARI